MIGQHLTQAKQEFEDICSLTSRISQVSQWSSSISKNLIVYYFCLLDLVETTLLLTYFPRMTRLVLLGWCLGFGKLDLNFKRSSDLIPSGHLLSERLLNLQREIAN